MSPYADRLSEYVEAEEAAGREDGCLDYRRLCPHSIYGDDDDAKEEIGIRNNMI